MTMQVSRLSQVAYGVTLFVIGFATWFVLNLLFMLLGQDREWLKNLGLVGFVIPLSVAAWRAHAQGRTRLIGYQVAGWLLAIAVLGGLIYVLLAVIGPPPRG